MTHELFGEFKQSKPVDIRVGATPLVPDVQLALLLAKANSDMLTETADSIGRIPPSLRPIVAELAEELFKKNFIEIARAAMSVPGWEKDPSRTPTIMAHTAKLHVFCYVGSLAYEPWHLADPGVLKTIGAEMKKTNSLTCARKHLLTKRPINLFVAASEDDDRDSYLKSVAATMRQHNVLNVVLDSELIEWRPEKDFLEACKAIGRRPLFVGIVDRDQAGKHSMLSSATTNEGIASIFLNTNGRALIVNAGGSVRSNLEVPAVILPAPSIAAPSDAMQDKIRALRDRQSRSLKP